MYFIAGLVGLIGGAWLFSEHSREVVGALLGAFLGIFWLRHLRLGRRLAALERQLSEVQGGATASESAPPVAPPVVDDFIFTPDVPMAVAEPLLPPSPPRLPNSPSAPRTGPESPRQNEWWNIFVTYFTGGNVVVRAGAVVLFFGVAFLLKYSAERNLVPIELRLLGVSLGAVALLLCGWHLRLKRPGYALILQGAAIGILYLSIFAALKLYQLLPAGFALPLLIVLAIASATLAIAQNARVLAVLGIVGGFLAPVLTSTGGGSYVLLFSYYALLNVGILYTARRRSWRELNLLGFFFTFGIGALWGASNYRPEMFATTEPFLILFFLFYLALGLLFARNQPLNLKGYIDGTLVFGTPIVTFVLQAVLVRPYTYGLAWSALVLGLIYVGLSWRLWRQGQPALRTLIEAFLATGVVFATVAIPLALDGRWTSAAWALEGAALVWIALKQQRRAPRIFGLILQVLAGISFLTALPGAATGLPILNGLCLGALLVALAGLFSAWCLWRRVGEFPTAALESHLTLAWGLCWWFGAGFHEIGRFAPFALRPVQNLAFCALSAGVAFWFGVRLAWPYLRRVYLGLLPVMGLVLLFTALEFHGPPSLHGGFLAWPLALLLHYLLLYRDEQFAAAAYLRYPHLGLLWLLILLVTWEAAWWTDHAVGGAGTWTLAVLGILPAAFVLGLCRLWNTPRWPLASFRRDYLYPGLLPVVGYLGLGTLGANLFSPGDPRPLSYLPLLNPFDLAQVLVLLAVAFWSLTLTTRLALNPLGMRRRERLILAGATVFFWLNAILVRTLHHWGEVPFHPRALLASDLAQTSFSIFWTLSALAVMLWAARKGLRTLWWVGAGLIGVVMIKLFIFDLARTSTVERIVSFIGVGLLCLAVGYLAPLPGRADRDREDS
ncbi:DUF2339 domain-containing protein [Trichloromonas sp.]|uniref:DUF2339 domain-containing protein n=1 Tax=Trichloromonas sp. TaxID=3069249 RepID=UPI002A483805|nr:DUF2339 domain-containing protein [Trichloromonas sp.]